MQCAEYVTASCLAELSNKQISYFREICRERTLSRHVERVFNSDRKDGYWGQRKLKRENSPDTRCLEAIRPPGRARAGGEEVSADKAEDDLRGWLRSETVDATVDYVARGRKHCKLLGADLAAAWISSFRRLSFEYRNPELHMAQADLSAEYVLRAEEPPYHLVIDDMDRLSTGIKRDVENLSPEKRDDISEKMFERYSTFRSSRDRNRS
jgi:hypothetical protein